MIITRLALPIAVFVQIQICAGYMFAQAQPAPTRQEILRGTITPEREWWDVLHYDLFPLRLTGIQHFR